MWKCLGLMVLAGLAAWPVLADEKEARKVELKGTIQTGVIAIGGETTGILLKTKDNSYELEFGKEKDLRARAEKLNKKMVVVSGLLNLRPGVEVKQRKIITVKSLKEAR